MIRLLVSGDFVPFSRTVKLVCENNIQELFGDFLPLLQETDYNIINLECPVLKKDINRGIVKSGPCLKAKAGTVTLLKKAGFHMVTLANNHFYDYGNAGVRDTLEECHEVGMDTVGGGRNLEEASRVFFKKIQDKTFAFINVCEHEFSIATDRHGGSNPLELVDNYYQLQMARQQADYVIVIVHGGHERYSLPSPRMQNTYRFFVDMGADVVINHHTHCYSGYEVYDNTPIFYSLGNFSFDRNQRNTLWNQGYAVVLKFAGENIGFELLPYIQGDDRPGIRSLDTAEMKKFEYGLKTLNNIIGNRKLLEAEFNKFALSGALDRLSYFEPYTNRYLRALYVRGMLPSFCSKKRLLRLMNNLQCEAHREVMIDILRKKTGQ